MLCSSRMSQSYIGRVMTMKVKNWDIRTIKKRDIVDGRENTERVKFEQLAVAEDVVLEDVSQRYYESYVVVTLPTV